MTTILDYNGYFFHVGFKYCKFLFLSNFRWFGKFQLHLGIYNLHLQLKSDFFHLFLWSLDWCYKLLTLLFRGCNITIFWLFLLTSFMSNIEHFSRTLSSSVTPWCNSYDFWRGSATRFILIFVKLCAFSLSSGVSKCRDPSGKFITQSSIVSIVCTLTEVEGTTLAWIALTSTTLTWNMLAWTCNSLRPFLTSVNNGFYWSSMLPQISSNATLMVSPISLNSPLMRTISSTLVDFSNFCFFCTALPLCFFFFFTINRESKSYVSTKVSSPHWPPPSVVGSSCSTSCSVSYVVLFSRSIVTFWGNFLLFIIVVGFFICAPSVACFVLLMLACSSSSSIEVSQVLDHLLIISRISSSVTKYGSSYHTSSKYFFPQIYT